MKINKIILWIEVNQEKKRLVTLIAHQSLFLHCPVALITAASVTAANKIKISRLSLLKGNTDTNIGVLERIFTLNPNYTTPFDTSKLPFLLS